MLEVVTPHEANHRDGRLARKARKKRKGNSDHVWEYDCVVYTVIQVHDSKIEDD